MTQITRRTLAASVLYAALVASPAIAAESAASAHDFTFTAIEGDPLAMSDYRGKAVLVVNTASRCGFTSQYEGLQALYDAYKDDGLVVLGVPSNDFRQELASSEEVKNFCEMTYGIDFPMTEIERVKGDGAHPMFRWIAKQGGTPSWNFHKFLIDKDGQFVAHYGSSTRPDSDELVARIQETLGR